MIDIVLAILLVIAIGVAVHYRAKANAASAASATALAGMANFVTKELDALRGDVRGLVDGKFKALAQWLLAELEKALPPAIAEEPVPPAADPAPAASATDPAPSAATEADPPPPAAPTAPSDPEPSADDGGAEQLVAQIDAAIAGLTEKRARIAAAQKAQQDAEAALKAALAS